MGSDADAFFAWVGGHAPPPRVLLVGAHPDDETVGAGAVLARLSGVRLVCVTDGAPRERRWWGDPSLPSREAYASVRRGELRAALSLAGIAGDAVIHFGIADQEASLHLAGITRRMRDVIRDAAPEVVLTLAYEGGHPDHDAVAFCVHTACALLGEDAPTIVEFPLYHAEDGAMVVGTWMDERPGAVEVRIDGDDQARKIRMVACHASQMATLVRFPTDVERFRPAPPHDFTRPPHDGPLNYETFGWADGAAWRERAVTALRELGLATSVDDGNGSSSADSPRSGDADAMAPTVAASVDSARRAEAAAC